MTCACGCGQETAVATQTSKRNGYVKGQPMKYVRGHNARGNKRKRRTRTAEELDAQMNALIARASTGGCKVCGKTRPPLAVSHDDPYCSTKCCRADHALAHDASEDLPDTLAA
jgi:hypothetical protein